MDAFVWDQNIVTGVEDIDNQHHALVDLFNLSRTSRNHTLPRCVLRRRHDQFLV